MQQNTLPSLLKDLCAQDYPHEKIEVLLIDSMSKDGTRAVMESFAAEDHGFQKVVLLENPGKTLPCGCNVALKNYTGDAIVRLDAHSNIDPDFISKNVEILESGEDISGGQVESILANDTPFQRTPSPSRKFRVLRWGCGVSTSNRKNLCQYYGVCDVSQRSIRQGQAFIMRISPGRKITI